MQLVVVVARKLYLRGCLASTVMCANKSYLSFGISFSVYKVFQNKGVRLYVQRFRILLLGLPAIYFYEHYSEKLNALFVNFIALNCNSMFNIKQGRQTDLLFKIKRLSTKVIQRTKLFQQHTFISLLAFREISYYSLIFTGVFIVNICRPQNQQIKCKI